MSAFILRSILQHLFVLCVSVFLVACETELGEEPLRILNESALPTEMTWYAPIDVPIEITGGQGSYAVRYIQNPESWMTEEEIGDVEIENQNKVELAVVRDQGSTFRLQGVPIPSVSADRRDGLTAAYWIEVTDGVTRLVVRVDFDIDNVQVELETNMQVTEGEAELSFASGPNVRGKVLCEDSKLIQSTPVLSNLGKAYPLHLVFKLSQALSVPVQFDIRTTEVNLSEAASEGVDFLPLSEKITLDAGITACGVTLYIVDDNEVEPVESFEVVVDDAGNLAGQFTQSRVRVSLSDDEPTIKPFTYEYIRSPGDVVEVVVELSRPSEHDIIVPISVNASETTLLESDYAITPAERIVTIEEGERQGMLGIKIDDVLEAYADTPVILVEVQGDSATDPRGSLTLSVNTLNKTNSLGLAEGERAVSIVQNTNSIFIVSEFDDGASNSLRLRKLDRFGNPMLLNGSQSFDIDSVGQDLFVKGFVAIESSGLDEEIALVFEVFSNFAGSFWGKKDFVVLRLAVSDDGTVSEKSRSQHGSAEDDSVNNVRFYDGIGLVVTGSTVGDSLDGEAIYAAQALSDGFVYMFDPDLELTYRRFVGNGAENVALASGMGDSGIQAIVSKDTGIYFKSIDAEGFDNSDVKELTLLQPASYVFGGAENISSERLGIILSSSFTNDGNPTPSLSQDIFFYDVSLKEPGEAVLRFEVATPYQDVGIDLAVIEDKEVMGLVGETLGEFVEGGSLSGVGGRDVFFAAIDVKGSPVINTLTQFGTPGDDFAIDVEAVNDEKFLVLWKENHTSGDGSFRYRITPFAPDGTNLAPLY